MTDKKFIVEEWEKHQGPVVFTTVNKEGVPNSIYMTFAALYDENIVLLADNFLSKTKENLSSGKKGSVLFITSEKKAYQLKGVLSYYKDGKYFDNMKKWNREDLPGHGVVALKIEEIYSGAKKLS